MTDRYYALSVALEKDIREDDAAALIKAIRQLRGVQAVEPHVSNIAEWTAFERARQELGEKLWRVLYPKETED